MATKALKILCLSILVLMLGIPSLAQNTKGDKPVPSNRETRFKTPKKSKQKRQPSRRVRQGDDRAGQPAATPPRRRREGERPGKPVTPQFSRSKPRGDSQRAWKGDISGRRIQPRKETGRAKNVYPQPPTIDYSSRSPRKSQRENQNPNVKRVQRMQAQESKPRVGRPIRPVFHKTRPEKSERAWRGDITGRPIRATARQNMRRPSGGGTSPGMMGSRGQRMQRFGGVPARVSGRARNVYPGTSPYASQTRRRARFQSEGNRVALNMLKRSDPGSRPGGRGRRVAPRSASAASLARRSTNTWAHFPRPKHKQERAYTRDLAGKKLRTKNFETQRPIVTNPTLNYQRRMARGERPYEGPAAGGHISRTRAGRAWNGDVAHRAIRGGFRSKKGEPRAGIAIFGRGPRGRGVDKYQGNIKTGRGGFGNQGEEYSGNIRSQKRFKGGGSVSGGWNNKGLPIQGRNPGKGSARIGYSGNIRAGKRIFNDQGEEYSGNIRTGNKGFRDQGEEYSGNIRTGRRGFRDQGEEYSGNIRTGRKGFRDQGEEYSGNIRTGRKGFRDQGEEYSGNIRTGNKGFQDQGEEYSGNIKSHRYLKGGGSRSGQHWNNKNTPITVRTPGKSGGMAGYRGNLRTGGKGFQDQGEEYSGNIKTRRPDKGGGSVSGKVWNNDEKAIEGRSYAGQTRITRFSGNTKARRPDKGGGSVSGQLWNNDEKAIAVRTPKESGERNFSGNVKVSRNAYRRNPKSSEDALPVLKASAATERAGQHSRGVRRNWDYINNPSSSDDAQRTREPGRAFGRSADYQGNIRVKKFDLFGKSDLHPDARFVKLNKNNVDEEKDMFTNFKLWWARLFRKAETQPDHLKENDKDRKPRYDKGESGLWYD